MSAKPFGRESSARTWRERARIFGPAALLSSLALIITYHFVQPAPPRHIVFATAQEGGAYYLFGLRYQALLAQEGIDVTVRPTSGSVENIRLLQKGAAPGQLPTVRDCGPLRASITNRSGLPSESVLALRS